MSEFPIETDSGISIHIPGSEAFYGRVVRSETTTDGCTVGVVFVGTPLSLALFRELAFPKVPECFAKLGLEFPCTVAQVRTAYHHRARTAHPDRGGDQESFVALYRAYRDALAVLAVDEPQDQS